LKRAFQSRNVPEEPELLERLDAVKVRKHYGSRACVARRLLCAGLATLQQQSKLPPKPDNRLLNDQYQKGGSLP
jgi:hypothetical protein